MEDDIDLLRVSEEGYMEGPLGLEGLVRVVLVGVLT